MLKRLAVVALVLASVAVAYGEAQRPMLTYENALPEKGQLEVGTYFMYTEFQEEDEAIRLNDRDEMTVVPYFRFGLLENLSAHVGVPYIDIDRDMGSDESGMGDVVAGFELVAYEDLFDFPYVIPHLDVTFDTGDEDDGLGQGENSFSLGVSVGTVVEDKYHFIVDASYEIFSDIDNIASFAGTFIWDLDEQFSVLVEGAITDEELEPDDGHPSYYQGGMTYKATEDFSVTVYGGGAKNTAQDVNAGAKLSYSF